MIFKNLINEIDSIIERDPAAGSRLGVVFFISNISCDVFL